MNNLPRIKRDLIAGLDRRRAQARAQVEALPPTMKVYQNSDWTLRDITIHLTALEADMIQALHKAVEGVPSKWICAVKPRCRTSTNCAAGKARATAGSSCSRPGSGPGNGCAAWCWLSRRIAWNRASAHPSFKTAISLKRSKPATRTNPRTWPRFAPPPQRRSQPLTETVGVGVEQRADWLIPIKPC